MAGSKMTVGEYKEKLKRRAAVKRTYAKKDGVLTPKRRKFAREVVKTGSKSIAYINSFDVSPNTSLQSVHEQASRTASIPQVASEIERLFARNGLELDDVVSIHKRNMMQEEHLPTSQRAVGDYYELAGMKKTAQTPSISVAFIINRDNKA